MAALLLLASTHKGTFLNLISTRITSIYPQQIPSGFLQSDAQCTNGCMRHTPASSGAGFPPFLAPHSHGQRNHTSPLQMLVVLVKYGLLFKSPNFMIAAATNAWRRSFKDLHRRSLHQQVFPWPLVHAQIHATSYDTMCLLPPSHPNLIQLFCNETQ